MQILMQMMILHLPSPPATRSANFNEKVHKPQSKSYASWNLVIPKMKSDFHTENNKMAWDLS